MILITATTYDKFKHYLTTLGGPAAQRRIFYTNTAPGSFAALAAIPGTNGGTGGEETIGVLLTTATPGQVPPAFATDFPEALQVDAFAPI
jgi:hypothetical protein